MLDVKKEKKANAMQALNLLKVKLSKKPIKEFVQNNAIVGKRKQRVCKWIW